MNPNQSRSTTSRSGRETQSSSEGAAAALNSEQSASTIVRTFAAEWLRQAATSPDEAMPWLDWECRRMNLLWVGPGLPVGRYSELVRSDWNTADQLGTSLCIRLGLPCETRLAARDAFAHFAHKLMDVGEAPEGKQRLDELCNAFTAFLLGLPADMQAWSRT